MRMTNGRCNIALWTMLGLALSIGSSEASEPAADLLKVVRETSDALLKHGQDHWGADRSRLIISILDRGALGPCLKMPPAPAGVREGDRTTLHGSNANLQQNLYRCLFLLSDVTGDAKYAEAAEGALLDFVRNTQAPETGLLAWGEHLCWDLNEDRAGTWAEKLIHEPKKPLVFWDFLYKHEPERMLAYARAIWEHQIADHRTGDFSRHARYDQHGPGRRYDFTKEAGHFIAIWSQAYAATGDETFARAAETLVRRYTGKLNDRFLLDYDGVRKDYCNNGHNITLAAELHDAATRFKGYEGGRLAREARELAAALDRGFLALAHRPDVAEAGFIAISTTLTGEPRDRERIGPGGYSVLWGMGYGRQTTSMIAVHCNRRAEQLQEGRDAERYRELALVAANRYRASAAPPSSIDLWPVESGTLIFLHLAAFRDTGDSAHLKQARRRAEEAVALFWDDASPLPKASRRSNHYEAITGAETLILALLAVHAAEENLDVIVPISDIDR